MAIFEIAVNIQTLSFDATLSPEKIQNVKQTFARWLSVSNNFFPLH